MPRTLDPAAILTDRQAYLARRSAVRAAAMRMRAQRRVRVGDQLVLEFENADTLQYQVQEMVYAEGLTEPADVAHEVAAYSRLLPSSHELCATLFVELTELATVRGELDRLAGLQHHVTITVGEHRVVGRELLGPEDAEPAERTASVHFLRFHFDEAARDAFRDPQVPAQIVVNHPAYAEAVPVGGDTRLSLLADLALEPGG